ncbi:MAG: trypsin-like peptidase domain-containing protein, partial [Bacteroidota bacterium]
MKRKLQIRVLMACVMFFASYAASYAQISQGGTPPGLMLEQTKTIEPAPVEVMSDFDLEALKKEDALYDEQPGMPWRFGNNFDVNLNPENSGTWYELEDGSRLWRLAITSKGALTINLGFDKYKLPDGAELYVYTPGGKNIQGAFTSYNNQQDGFFATAPIEGDAVIIEYHEPAIVAFEGEISIFRVTHGYRGFGEMTQKGFGDSGSCNLNVACEEAEGWDKQIRSVAKILSNGNDMCTGALINNTENDGTPYFLTADHCFANEGTLVFVFNWQSETCENPSEAPPVVHTISGAVTRARNAASDAWLLEFNNPVPEEFNVYFSGWNNDLSSSIDEEIVGIHHPSGDLKKFSYSLTGVQQSSYLGDPGSGDSHWHITWDGGTTTEGGSSGSPIFDAEGRILGQLHGGYAACGNVEPDWYGRFGMSMAGGLSQWLDPNDTGIDAIDGYDPILDAAEPDAPAAVEAFTVMAGENGDLNATLTWTNPSLTFDGETLTELTAINVYRDGEIIETIENPVIGEAENYVDNTITESGNYAYMIKGENSNGEGPQVSATVFIGPDIPAQVENLTLTAQDNDGLLTWDAPTEGANEGYYDPSSLLEYQITRNPDDVSFTVAATETSFLDETVPGIGYYSYTVVAVNNIGEGTPATSNSVLLAAEGAVFMGDGEVTSCEGTFFDSGGPDDDYENSQDLELTFFPETEGTKMRFQFTSF